MSKPSKISVYVGAALKKSLEALGDRYGENRSGRIEIVCERYNAMVADEIKRLPFTHAEWCAILDANNGVQLFAGGVELSPSMIWANVHDTEGLGKKWDIDQRALVQRLQALDRTALIVVQEVCDRFWSRSEQPTRDALKLAGIEVD